MSRFIDRSSSAVNGGIVPSRGEEIDPGYLPLVNNKRVRRRGYQCDRRFCSYSSVHREVGGGARSQTDDAPVEV
jgi:hypothetical protein